MGLDFAKLAAKYKAALLDDVLPFWLRHSLDGKEGGYLTCLVASIDHRFITSYDAICLPRSGAILPRPTYTKEVLQCIDCSCFASP